MTSSRLLCALAALAVVATACSTDVRPERTTTTAGTSTTGATVTTVTPPTGEPSSSTTSPAGVGLDPERVAAPDSPADEIGVLDRLFDGDSMDLIVDGAVVEVRMIGINAPEGDECWGDEARATLGAILDSTEQVELRIDDEDVDQFGRRLRYLAAGGVDINALLVATGNAVALQTGHALEGEYLELMNDAFLDGVGMWEFGVCGTPSVADGDVTIEEIVYDAPGRDADNRNGEFVEIRNNTDAAIPLTGWVLRDESTSHRYRFDDFSLDAGETVIVRTGCGTDDRRELFWCDRDPVWSNGGDTVLLLDDHGNVVDIVIYRGDF